MGSPLHQETHSRVPARTRPFLYTWTANWSVVDFFKTDISSSLFPLSGYHLVVAVGLTGCEDPADPIFSMVITYSFEFCFKEINITLRLSRGCALG